jgi:uncharacterized protein (DUF2147 family)
MPALLMFLTQGSIAANADIRGDWINPRATAIVRIADCPTGLCGTVIWSAPAAQRDSARGGTADLDGKTVMTSFVPASARRWRGKLFLPDQNRVVKAVIDLSETDQLRVKACELGGLVCRTQKWNRRPAN